MNYSQVDHAYRQAVLTVVLIVQLIATGRVEEEIGQRIIYNILKIVDKTTGDVDQDIMNTIDFLAEENLK